MGTHPIFKLILCFLLLVTLSVSARAEKDTLMAVEDLSLRFFTMGNDGPELMMDPGSSHSIGFFLYRSELFDQLSLCNDDAFTVWLNGRLYYSTIQCLSMSKSQLFDLVKADTVYFSIHSTGDFNYIRGNLLANGPQKDLFLERDQIRNIPHTYTVVIVMGTVLMLMAGFMRHYLPNSYLKLLSFRFFVSQDWQSRQKDFSASELVETTFTSLLVGSLVFFIFREDHLNVHHTWMEDIFQWLWISILFFVAFIMKYLFISVIATFYAFRHLVLSQYSDFVRFVSISSLLLFFLQQYRFWIQTPGMITDYPGFRYYFLMVYGAFLGYYIYAVSAKYRYEKLHIISYLCMTEFLGGYFTSLLFLK